MRHRLGPIALGIIACVASAAAAQQPVAVPAAAPRHDPSSLTPVRSSPAAEAQLQPALRRPAAGQADAGGAAQPGNPSQPTTQPQPPQPARPAGGQILREAKPAEAPASNLNIRIDATVIEHRGEQVVSRKTVSATVMDGEQGFVRSKVIVPVPGPIETDQKELQTGVLNMDVGARLTDRNRVRVTLTLEAQGGRIDLGERGSASDAGIRQHVTVVLEPGKPLVVAQSADAVGERRLALEVKATVLR